MSYLMITLIVLALPLLVLRFSQNLILKWLGPVVTCYILGILIGNFFKPLWDFTYARHISEAGILLALPLFLFSVDLWGWTKLAKSTLFSFFLLILCVVGCSLLGGWLFLKDDPETWKMAAMLTGVYIGGTANLTALGKMLDIRHDAFIALNTVDLILGGIYLLFIMSIGVKILSKFLRPFHFSTPEGASLDLENASTAPAKMKDFGVHLIFTTLVCGLSVFSTFFIFKHMEAGWIFSFLTFFL